MSNLRALTVNALYHRCDASQFDFSTTAELEDIALALGQQRALRAADFGLGIKKEGFNLFVVGEPGAGKQSFIRDVLSPRLSQQTPPHDWCYVHDFTDLTQPIALQLPAGSAKKFQKDVAKLVDDVLTALQAAFENEPQPPEVGTKLTMLDPQTAMKASDYLIAEMSAIYGNSPSLRKYFLDLQRDLVANFPYLMAINELPSATNSPWHNPVSLTRYHVNVFVAHGSADNTPLMYESNPSHGNLLGQVVAPMSERKTEFNHIDTLRAGTLHRANGGYLLVDAFKLIGQPSAWEGLKRALATREIPLEAAPSAHGVASTTTLRPHPIPLHIKVILLGDRSLYSLLSDNDPDFMELFKVVVDFEEDLDRSPESTRLFARVIGSLARREKLRPFTAAAVGRMVEHASRLAEDQGKLSIHLGEISDVASEADYWASTAQRNVIDTADVERTIVEQQYRSGRVREHILEAIDRGMLLIDSDGAKIGQVNGLTVIEFGNQLVGQPARITATTRLGDGKIVDIEREVELGGAMHSKGVMILTHFIAARYARSKPLSLSASLVFEQSYAQIDGDSASLAELCALLSAIAETPINQAIAVTGSVNQLGESQPIGGVNEKIEGFFDVCAARGLTGNQGVIIPHSNAAHLMLRNDVVEAAAKNLFQIYAVKTVDDAMEILTGVSAGVRDPDGNFPEESFNFRVEYQLFTLAELWQMSADHPTANDARD